MALPSGVTTATCTVGVPVSFVGGPVESEIQIKPSAFLVHIATGTPLVDMLESVVTTDGVAGQFVLPHTDQDGFQDENGNAYKNWFYTLTIRYSRSGVSSLPKTKVFQLVAGQVTVDLDKLPGGVPALPYTAPIPTVTSVVGLTGPVTGAQIAADPALTATYPSRANLDPLQPRGLTVKKIGIVLATGTEAWENWLVESGYVTWDSITQQLLMVYVGYSTDAGAAGTASVGLATSLDGINWTRASTTPLLQGTGGVGDPDRYGTTGPSIHIEGGVYYLFYIGLDGYGYEMGTKRMMLATATSLSGPWTRRGVVIAPSGTGWRSTAIYHRSIIKHPDGKFYMFFNAYGNGGFERIGYATATTLLGPWTVDDVNSPLMDVGAPGTWDDEIIGDPSVYRVGDTWYMAYYGFDGTNSRDGVAFTTNANFPLGWTKHPRNPILNVGPNGSYDNLHAGKPCIVQMPGAIYRYYTAVGNGQPTTAMRSIALAIDSPSAVPNDRLNPKPVVDTFARGGDSATTLGTAPTGQEWRNDVGVWRHVSSFAEVITLGAGSIAIASLEAGYADSKTSMKILTPASVGAGLGLIFRMIDATNFIWADIDSNGISVNKKVNGTDSTVAAKVARTIAAGDTVTVYAYGTSITVQHNGVTVISAVDLFGSVAGTRRGLRNYAGGGAQVDDFMVTAA